MPTNGQSLDATPVLANFVSIAQAIASFDGSQIQSGSIVAASFNASINPNTIENETDFSFVASGLIWTADSAGASLNGSMTSGVLYYNGIRVSINSVAAHAFTASKDTYVDIDVNGNVAYQAVTNNAASPSLTASSIRVAIIVTGATIVAAASINQGQPAALLPIASSIPYVTTDSLGNLINPRDPGSSVFAYTERATGQSSISTITDITGMSTTTKIPANCYRIRLQGECTISDTTSGTTVTISITDSSNAVQIERSTIITSSNVNALQEITVSSRMITVTPGSTYTYKLRATGGATTINQGNSVNKPSTLTVLRG